MKQKISICILIVILIFLMTFVLVMLSKEEPNLPQDEIILTETQNQQEEVVESGKKEETYRYIILEDNGRLTVYYSDNVTVYLNTGISVGLLPENVRLELQTGIHIQTEQELFDFLECYSS